MVSIFFPHPSWSVGINLQLWHLVSEGRDGTQGATKVLQRDEVDDWVLFYVVGLEMAWRFVRRHFEIEIGNQ